jgi:hypothetical protein
MKKEEAIIYFKVLFQHLPGRIWEKPEKLSKNSQSLA